ncbi:hypothetical protein D3C87_1953450 [compost metagenome]
MMRLTHALSVTPGQYWSSWNGAKPHTWSWPKMLSQNGSMVKNSRSRNAPRRWISVYSTSMPIWRRSVTGSTGRRRCRGPKTSNSTATCNSPTSSHMVAS